MTRAAFHRIAAATWLAALAGMLVLAVPAAAQTAPDLGELSLEQLLTLKVESVSGASRYEQKVTRAPASVTVVTAEEIKRYGHRTLADILRYVRGVFVTYDRSTTGLGTRGFNRPGDYNSRVLLLVDGHRMNDGVFGSFSLTRDGVDVDLIDRVEVIRGPSSSIYGSSAFFGVINIVTRRGAALDGAEVAAEVGSLDTYQGRFSFGQRFANGLEGVLSGSIYDSAGHARLYFPEYDAPETNHGIALNSDLESTNSMFASLRSGDWTATGEVAHWEKRFPTALYGAVFGDARERAVASRGNVDLSYSHAISPDTQILARAYYDRSSVRADLPVRIPSRDGYAVALVRDRSHGDVVGGGAQYTTKLSGRHTLILGGEYRKEVGLSQVSTMEGVPGAITGSDRKTGSIGLFAQGEVALSRVLLLNGGVRYDHDSLFGGTLNPRVGLIYGPGERTTLKALYGRAYRAPNAYERNLQVPGQLKTNPGLRPETNQTYELVLEQYTRSDLRFVASAYTYDIEGLISQRRDPADGLYEFANADRVKARGIEVEASAKPASSVLLLASYALQRADDGAGDELTNSPRHLAKLNVSVPVLGDRLQASVETQLTSSLRTLGGNRTTPGFLMNMTLLSRSVVRGLELSASVYNLLGHGYSYPGSGGLVQDTIRQDGRTWRLKAAYRF